MKIVAFCTLNTGIVALKFALDMGVVITKVIGLDGVENRDKSKISGVVDIANFCISNNLDFDYVSDYSLATESTEVLGGNVDIVWVCGWQRLLPDKFIEAATIATLGTHGSCDGITKGRGRSPQNWALIIGAKSFQISLFKLSSGIDDGLIVDTEEYELTHHDTINTSYRKAGYVSAKMISKVFFDPTVLKLASRQKGAPTYFPKRTQEDGIIDWSMSVVDVYNQIRALESPYPNAFSKCDGAFIFINRSTPLVVKTKSQPGEVIQVFDDGEFIVACSDGCLRVLDYFIRGPEIEFESGLRFENGDVRLSANVIFNRFKNEFPNRKINKSLIDFWKRNDVHLT